MTVLTDWAGRGKAGDSVRVRQEPESTGQSCKILRRERLHHLGGVGLHFFKKKKVKLLMFNFLYFEKNVLYLFLFLGGEVGLIFLHLEVLRALDQGGGNTLLLSFKVLTIQSFKQKQIN